MLAGSKSFCSGITAVAERLNDAIPASEPMRSLPKPLLPGLAPRFAVTALASWQDVETSLRDLACGDHAMTYCHCLGLQRVLAARNGAFQLQRLEFPNSGELISCTAGRLARRLQSRLELGASSLQAALSHWLIPRHAAHLQANIECGRIVLWVQVFDHDDERRACHRLLPISCDTVGVHDLIGDEVAACRSA